MLDLSQTAVEKFRASQTRAVRQYIDLAAELEEWSIHEDPMVQAMLVELADALQIFISEDPHNIAHIGRDEIACRIRVLMAYIGPDRRLMLIQWATNIDQELGTSLVQVLLAMPSATRSVMPIQAGMTSIEPELASQHNRSTLRFLRTMQLLPELFAPDRIELVLKAISMNMSSKGHSDA
jgi:hypothetical protein